MNTNTTKGLSFGEKILQQANTRLETDEKRHKKSKRNAHDNKLPRSKQRAMRKMVPPGTFEKKSLGASIMDKAGTHLESGEKRDPRAMPWIALRTEKNVGKDDTIGKVIKRDLAHTGAGAAIGGAAGGLGGLAAIRKIGGRGAGLAAGLGAAAGAIGGSAVGSVRQQRRDVRAFQKKGKNLTRAQAFFGGPAMIGLRKGNPDADFRPGKKSADETDSFGKTVVDQARARVNAE